jgi:hypothetical protein
VSNIAVKGLAESFPQGTLKQCQSAKFINRPRPDAGAGKKKRGRTLLRPLSRTTLKFSLMATAINWFRIYQPPSPASHQFWGQASKKMPAADLTLFGQPGKNGRTGLPTNAPKI